MVLPLQCGSGPAALLLPKWAVPPRAAIRQLSAELRTWSAGTGESFVDNRQLSRKKGVNPSEVDMRLDPKECRLYALTCERLAQRSTSPIARSAYAELAKKWLKVAVDLENIQAVVDAQAESELKRRTA